MASKQLVLDQLKSFIEESECRINRILQSVGWSKESVLNSVSSSEQHAELQFIIALIIIFHFQNASKTDKHSQEKNQSNTTDTLPASFQPSDRCSSIRLGKVVKLLTSWNRHTR